MILTPTRRRGTVGPWPPQRTPGPRGPPV